MEFTYVTRVAREKRLHRVWSIGDDNQVNPGTWDVDARQIVYRRVDLSDNDSLPKCGCFDNDRCIFGIGSRVEISLIITLFGTDESHARREINKHSCVEFNIRVNGSELDLPVLKELCDSKALRSGVRKIDFSCD